MFVVNGRFLTQKPTGVHRFAFEICNKLHELGVDFYVAVPKEINPDYIFTFKTVQCGSMSAHLWEQISLPKYLKQQGNPLLVSFSGCGPLNYSNQIITIHDVSHERHPEWFSKNYCRFYGYMMPRIGKKAHAVITVSEFSKKEIEETLAISPEKIHVINCSIPSYHTIDNEIVEFNNKESERYIVSVSSMDPRKNFIRLVEAFNRIEDKSVKLYIIGMQFKAFNTPDMQKLIGQNVILTGYLDDESLQSMYKNALFSVYPSLYEGFGIPPLESMSYGCPVIASDIPALKEINEDAALYIDPLNVADMSLKMDMLIRDVELRRELSEKGREQVQKYSWDKSARQVLDLVKLYS
ncbi:glycosyltransferase involved in cell wall biosynthesis [Dysgonomonas alginatilytica]|uniref:Glycosyltransferase involved in cell wall biosynthesis n=1 Tax=Dysgonomonas alginatilytica TaxID=1605892 RepID=A0A2V3PRT0_9BACT|nr:glycosyltransferase family 1 protein [Dysgonomonas alginatilytica]PXV60963.1 glycosyltransferase involved in cell wall biosynthesis [Dysgonomonas alginatilytica]